MTLSHTGIGTPEAIIIFCILAVFAFTIGMFVHVIRRKDMGVTTKVLWGVAIIVIQPVVAFVYLLTAFRKQQPQPGEM